MMMMMMITGLMYFMNSFLSWVVLSVFAQNSGYLTLYVGHTVSFSFYNAGMKVFNHLKCLLLNCIYVLYFDREINFNNNQMLSFLPSFLCNMPDQTYIFLVIFRRRYCETGKTGPSACFTYQLLVY